MGRGEWDGVSGMGLQSMSATRAFWPFSMVRTSQALKSLQSPSLMKSS